MLPGRGTLDAGLPIEEVALLAALAALVVVLMQKWFVKGLVDSEK
jgi:hypothetical protein